MLVLCVCVCVSMYGCVGVCVTLSRYMEIRQNLLHEVPVEKSTLGDFDQFNTLENKWKAKSKDIHGKKKKH